MFSKVCCSRALTSHWLSPSVSMPTSRRGVIPLPVLVRVTERDVPLVRLRVEIRRHSEAVHLYRELHRRLDLEVARAAEDASKGGVQAERPDLVGVGDPGLTV